MSKSTLQNIGLLILRVSVAGIMFFQHGLSKLMNFSSAMERFPDPIGFGSTISLSMAVFAEVFCALLVVAGLMTRLAVTPLITTMAVAFFIVHGADPWIKKELAAIYGLAFISILFLGPGSFSLDKVLRKKV